MGYQGNYPPSTPLTSSQIGAGAVDTTAIANGAVIPADLSTGGPYWDSSGNVGIGTSTPITKLTVNGGTTSLTTATGSVGFNLNNGTLTPSFNVDFNAANTYLDLNTRLYVRDVASSYAVRMAIDSSGNVGIGTSSITGGMRLDVQATTAAMQIKSTTGTNIAYTQYNNTAGNFFAGLESSTGGSLSSGSSAYAGVISHAGGYPLQFGTSNTIRATIDSSGNVGIGITPTTGYGALQVTTSTNGTAAYFGNGGGVHAYNGSGYYSSAATLSSGGTWTARATGAGIVSSGANGSIVFYTDTGLTSGNTFNPTSRMSVGSQIFFQSQGIAYANQNVGTLRTSTGGLGGVMCESAGSGNAAFMCFHKPGAYASYFGIDTDNYFAVGGWSAGAGLANFKCNVMSKASGSFKIDHPLPEMSETHHLVHSFVEAPQADNIYRGKIQLVNGKAKVNIDQAARLTEGTFVLLNGNVQCFTTNETDWDAIRGSVNGNILTIESQDSTSTATISWLVIGERQDKHMFDTDWTDDNGRVITEPLKPETAFETNV